MLDLALSSFGIETKNMAEAFKKQEVVYEPDVFLSSRFESGTNRLINARETYYHEYEKTRRRPAEIAGIYQNGNQANTPQIDGDLKGVRALPKDNYFDDDGFTDFSYKRATARSANRAEDLGAKRQVRGSFDRQGQSAQDRQGASSKKHEPLPDFASSIYDEENKEKPLTLANSRMVLVADNDEAMALSNLYAPEHLIIQTSDYMSLAGKVVNAGSVFLGRYACESAGDYASGTNHTLPTNGWATAYSGVNLDSYCRKVTFQLLTEEGIRSIGRAVELMAEAEQLQAHKNAMTLRMTKE